MGSDYLCADGTREVLWPGLPRLEAELQLPIEHVSGLSTRTKEGSKTMTGTSREF